MTRRAEIRAAALAALNADPPEGIPETDQRLGPYSRGALPCMRLVTFQEEVGSPAPSGRRGPADRRKLQLVVECYAEGGEDELEPLLAWATSALVPGRLGGLATAVEELGTKWDASGLESEAYVARRVFSIEYMTVAGSDEAGVP